MEPFFNLTSKFRNEKNNLYIEPPLLFSDPISRTFGRNVYLKIETLQPSGSFKNRGIGHYCSICAKEKGLQNLYPLQAVTLA
jgi:threonine dehydratase